MMSATPPLPAPTPDKEETGFYEPYSFLARTVRTWFIAYGIGAPVLLFSNAEAWRLLMAKGVAGTVVKLFLAGVGLQVLTSIVFKAAMWYQYMEEIGRLTETSWLYRVSDWLSDRYGLEFVIEVVTLWLFSCATIKAMSAVGAV
jgi:hypothetical protein